MTALADASHSIVDRGAAGDLFFRIVDVTLNNAYDAGGWVLTPKNLGFGTNGVIYGVIVMNDNATGRLIDWDQANKKLIVRDASGAANAATPEITTVTQMNGVVVRLLAVGKGQG